MSNNEHVLAVHTRRILPEGGGTGCEADPTDVLLLWTHLRGLGPLHLARVADGQSISCKFRGAHL